MPRPRAGRRHALILDAWLTVFETDRRRKLHEMASAPIPASAQCTEKKYSGTIPAPANRNLPLSKRILDLTLASVALAVFSPVILAAAFLIKLTSPGPILFRQTRIGQAEKPFTMLKLRTMHADADDRLHRELNKRELLGDATTRASDGIYKLQHDPRITKIGRFLRQFSIDELPQLINVLKGDMSLVGPRPSLPWEIELYSMEQRHRHQCLPGITGLWQVSGRNTLSMIEMLRLDVEYVERQSLRLDLWILLRTPYAVLFDRGAR
jgi:lipopolysaccharide/colanic/teichoic acid biosynthesis glycosyltransferase